MVQVSNLALDKFQEIISNDEVAKGKMVRVYVEGVG